MEQPSYSPTEKVPEFTTELEGLLDEWAGPPASAGTRFANLLIDRIAVYLLVFLVVVIWASLGLLGSVDKSDTFQFTLALMFLVMDVLYYTVFEGTTGRTLGKLCTGTRVIKTNGQRITMRDALLRSLSRLVPFEAFTGFGTPWHDSWTETTVVSTKRN